LAEYTIVIKAPNILKLNMASLILYTQA